MLKRILPVVVCAAAVATGCSSGGSSTAGTTTTTGPAAFGGYRKSDAQQLKALSARITPAVGPNCSAFAYEAKAAADATQARLESSVPVLAQASCTSPANSDAEDLELTLVASHKDARRYTHDRAAWLCRHSKEKNYHLHGLRWVVGPNWVIQPDTEIVGRQLAAALDATYLGTACPGAGGLDWDTHALEAITAAAKKLGDAGVGCTAFTVTDRDALSNQVNYIQKGLPAALGRCSGVAIEVAAGSKATTPAARFARDEFQHLCSVTPDLAVAVAGNLVMVTTASLIDRVATTLDGQVLPIACAAPPSTTTSSSP